jgi:hypothetical protein
MIVHKNLFAGFRLTFFVKRKTIVSTAKVLRHVANRVQKCEVFFLGGLGVCIADVERFWFIIAAGRRV